MTERNTGQIFNEIKHAKGADQFMNTIGENFAHSEPAEYLNELLRVKDVSKSNVIKAANLSPATGYQYFDGKRRPSRARMIALGYGFQLGLAELNTMLKRTGFATLYAKDEWDAIVIYALTHSLKLNETDDLLYKYGLGTITNDG